MRGCRENTRASERPTADQRCQDRRQNQSGRGQSDQGPPGDQTSLQRGDCAGGEKSLRIYEKWELIGGRVIRGQVGARIEHHDIVGNIDFALKNHLRNNKMPCRSFRETFWLQEKQLDLGVFPEIVVHCGRVEPGSVAVNDPLILLEVTSHCSDARGRLEKKDLYLKLPSVQQYVLVKRDKALVGSFERGSEGWSGYKVHEGTNTVLLLPAIELTLPLAEIYRDTPAAEG